MHPSRELRNHIPGIPTVLWPSKHSVETLEKFAKREQRFAVAVGDGPLRRQGGELADARLRGKPQAEKKNKKKKKGAFSLPLMRLMAAHYTARIQKPSGWSIQRGMRVSQFTVNTMPHVRTPVITYAVHTSTLERKIPAPLHTSDETCLGRGR